MNPIFSGTVKSGKLMIQNPEGFRSYLSTLEGKPIQLIARVARKSRSNNQNRYYHGVVVSLLSEHTGYTHDEMHDALRYLFLTDKTLRIPKTKSTTELNTVEFENYLESIRQWASTELSVNIPEPNEVDYEERTAA